MSRIFLALFLVAACGDVHDPAVGDDDGATPDAGGGDTDGDPGQGTVARAAFTFPPADCLTEGSAISVRGTAFDPDGIAAVRVNGVAALSSDGFATWQAGVPLALGANELVIEVEDLRGDVVERAATLTIDNSPAPWGSPAALGVEQALLPTQPVFVGDDRLNAVISVDPATGARKIVSSATRGTGPALPAPTSVVFDNARTRVLVGGFGGLFAVDPVSGDRTAINTDTLFGVIAMSPATSSSVIVVSSSLFSEPFLERVDVVSGARTNVSGANIGVGAGPAFVNPRDVVVDQFTNRAYVADAGAKAIYRVDLANGNRTILSGAAVGAGPAFDTVSGITIDRPFAAAPTQAFVADAGTDAVIRVDLANGNRTVLTANGTGTGDAIGNARAVAFTPAGDVLLADNVNQRLFEIAIATGNRTTLSSSRVGDGPASTLPNATGLDGDRVVFGDQQDGIFRFDLASSTRIVLAPATGDVSLPTGLVVESGGTALFGTATAKLLRVATGGQLSTVSSAEVGSGPALPVFVRIALDAANQRAFVDGGSQVLAIDLATGNRTIVSDGAHGTGPALAALGGVALDGDRLLVVDPSLDALVAVDIASGNRVVLSNAATGSGPAFGDPVGVAVAGTTALVVDSRADALFSVALGSGNRTILSGAAQPGPALASPQHVSLSPAGDYALVADFAMGLVAIDLATGHRVILSH